MPHSGKRVPESYDKDTYDFTHTFSIKYCFLLVPNWVWSSEHLKCMTKVCYLFFSKLTEMPLSVELDQHSPIALKKNMVAYFDCGHFKYSLDQVQFSPWLSASY